MTQDYLHELELSNLNYAEREKIATKLRNVRRERRKAKDYIEISEPLEEFIHNGNNQKFVGKLKEVLGQVRNLAFGLLSKTFLIMSSVVQNNIPRSSLSPNCLPATDLS